MRSMRSLAAVSWAVIILLATSGFAAFSTRGSSPSTETAAPAVAEAAPSDRATSGRVAGFVLAESFRTPGSFPAVVRPPSALGDLGADGSTTTTVEPPPTTTTSSTTTTSTTLAIGSVLPVEEPRPLASTRPGADVERWRPLVAEHFPAHLVDEAMRVLACESTGRPEAVNARTGATGLFQFMKMTWSWVSAEAGYRGASRTDPEANAAAAAWLVQYSIETGHPDGRWGHWECKP